MFSRYFTEVTEVNDLRFQKSLYLGVDDIKMYCHLRNELSKWSGAEELTVYSWNTKVSAPLLLQV